MGCILESIRRYSNHRVTLLAGGVGGARIARALRHVLDPGLLTVVVNVGDDSERYGVHVSADPDTVLYTLAGVAGPHGWGRANDTHKTMETLSQMGFDTTFRLGDKDLALCLARTEMLAEGQPLSSVTKTLQKGVGLNDVTLLPATDDTLRTFVQINGKQWMEFQEYFVYRQHADPVTAVAYHGAPDASPAPGVIEAITGADTLVIAPSNPPLSVWPILSVAEVDRAVREHTARVAISPLFGGSALKGPAAQVMEGVGLSAGTRGVLEAYDGLIDHLFIDTADAEDVAMGPGFGVAVHTGNTLLTGEDRGSEFAAHMLETIAS